MKGVWLDEHNDPHWSDPSFSGRICDRCNRTIEFNEWYSHPFVERYATYRDCYLRQEEYIICLDCLHQDRQYQLDRLNWGSFKRDYLRFRWFLNDLWNTIKSHKEIQLK